MIWVVSFDKVFTYQNSSSGSLTWNELSCPVFSLCHESPLELLLAPGSLLFFLFRIIWREFGLFTAAKKREHSPEEDDEQSSQKREYTR